MRTRKPATIETKEITFIVSTDYMNEAYKALEDACVEPDEMIGCNADEASYLYRDVEAEDDCNELRMAVVKALNEARVPYKEYRFEM